MPPGHASANPRKALHTELRHPVVPPLPFHQLDARRREADAKLGEDHNVGSPAAKPGQPTAAKQPLAVQGSPCPDTPCLACFRWLARGRMPAAVGQVFLDRAMTRVVAVPGAITLGILTAFATYALIAALEAFVELPSMALLALVVLAACVGVALARRSELRAVPGVGMATGARGTKDLAEMLLMSSVAAEEP